ncbi:MAG: hypothetical protein JNJ78_01545 [Anaerolineae bacterium]|nr:hypothetical protein [Anaerolineae bacterium]
MTRLEPTPELIRDIIVRIPEACIRYDILCQRVRLDRGINNSLLQDNISRDGEWWYDTSRLTQQELMNRRAWMRPYFPDLTPEDDFVLPPVIQREQERAQQLSSTSDAVAAQNLLDYLSTNNGFSLTTTLQQQLPNPSIIGELIQQQFIEKFDEFIYDPLKLSSRSMKHAASLYRLAPIRQSIHNHLSQKPGNTAPLSELIEMFGGQAVNTILGFPDLKQFQISNNGRHSRSITWVRLAESDSQLAREAATQTIRSSWESLLEKCGAVLRPDARDGKTARMKVIARTYTISSAAQRIGVRQPTLEKAINEDRILAFEDPEGRLRLPADAVEAAFDNPEYAEHITAFEPVRLHDIALVIDANYATVRRRLQRLGIRRDDPHWGQIRGRLELPDTYREFHELVEIKRVSANAERELERLTNQSQLEEERRAERERRASLRARLVAAFPTWRHEGRADQRIYLHVGPPNSGKTHAALEALAEAGSGWYLAPLRLLAFEIFDRLNVRGVFCNLLTGEEHIPVADASITAATVEMFNPAASGRCVVIDEAQMLADADRGWAWTRALMEAEAPDIHVIGPETVRSLIQQMAAAAAIPIEIVEHQRLTPIKIAEHSWPLHELPPRTILVAFSRQTVLHLKTELEKLKRTVSVVYGNLPPEVRRKQADRFANGETEICIATDAVGMGLNLPADYVCFYEIEKFDGRNVRVLTPAEVQQIGGRAGRFGLSIVGEVGAISKRDLKLIRRLFDEPPDMLTHARVAPTVEDLELIPGSLASKLTQWASLQSIPDALRGAIETADMTERIELASMLTDREVSLLGLEAALKLVNAPTRQNTREYWYQCARHILTDKALPLPPVAPKMITDTIELESIEYCVACADIYLWLSQRREFSKFAPYEGDVREMRTDWSMRIDHALLHKINAMKRCTRCGRPLPLKHKFAICDNCFQRRRKASSTPIN